MKNINKLLCVVLSVLIVFLTFSGCDKVGDKSENTESELLNSLENSISTDEFDNTDNNDLTPFPGSYGTGVFAEYNESEKSDGVITLSGSAASSHGYIHNFKESKLNDKSKVAYIYNSESYCYGITNDGEEIIAFFESDNEKTDVINGGGLFSLVTADGKEITDYKGILKFVETEVDGYKSLTVTYDFGTKDITAQNVYVFEKHNISVSARIKYNGNLGTVNSAKSYFVRSLLCDYKKVEKRINYDWIYPEDGSQIKPQYESIVTTIHLDEEHLIYSFNRNENSPDNHVLKSYPDVDFPLHLEENCEKLDYTLEYDLVLANGDNDSDYNSLFWGQGSNIAVGIAPVQTEGEYDNTTVFTGDEITLNINVTNISDKDEMFSLRYDVMNYYGEVVDSGLYVDSKVFYGLSANRHIKISGQYGIFYLNLYVVSGNFTYRECYPFMLIPEYEYKNRATNPFGVDASHHNTLSQANSTASLLNKTGIAFVRPGNSPDDNMKLYSLLGEYGVDVLLGLGGSANYTKEMIYNNVFGGLASMEEIEKLCKIRYAYVSNEPDHEVKGNLDACREFMQNTFMPNIFNPLKDLVAKYTNVPIGWAGTCHANEEFFTAMYENGVWQDSDVIDSHLYSQPKGPDASFASRSNVSSIEWEMIHYKNAVTKYGGQDKKIAIGETGYASNVADLRTLADFNTRTGILALNYGIDYVGFYCMYDRTTYYEGTGVYANYGGETEMNFGMFYNYDYFGVFKPKPWAAAFATLNHFTDGVTSCSINNEYTTETTDYLSKGTMRVFDMETTEKGKFKVAWSNITRMPRSWSGDVSASMIKNLPWNNQWLKSEMVALKATGDTVTVIDIMGNEKVYTPKDGTVNLPISGSPVYIFGVE